MATLRRAAPPPQPYVPALAVITGASAGLGAELAGRLAARGSDLVLVARRRELLEELAGRLRERDGVTVHVVAMDLGDVGAGAALRQRVAEATDGAMVDLVVNNAGFGIHGPTMDADPQRLEQMVDLDVRAVTSISRAFLEPMVLRGSGTLVNVASTAAFQPTPGLGAYAAAKAYVLSFTESLWWEVRRSGVRVTAFCPGPIDTEFFATAGSEHGPLGGRVAGVEQVASDLVAALDAPRLGPSVVPDRLNRVMSVASRVVPRRLLLPVAARMMKQ